MIKVAHRDRGQTKTAAYFVAKNFLDILVDAAGENVFNERLDPLAKLPASIAFDMLGNVEMCKSIAAHVIGDTEVLRRVVDRVQSIHTAFTG